MQKSLFRFSSLLLLGLLVALPGCDGCFKSSPPPPPGGSSAVTVGGTTAMPYVEPMFPESQPEGATSEETKVKEPKNEGASLQRSAPFGKVAQQAIPLPPIEDLVAQADDYLEKIGKLIEEKDGTQNYKRDADDVVRDAHGLTLVALAIGLSPEDSQYKKASPGIIAAATALGKVEKLDAANKAYAELKAAFDSSGDPTTLGWTKVADLTPVMKAVPNLDSDAKRNSNVERRLRTGAKRVAARLAGLAAIAQGSMANIDETNKPDAEAEWKKECELFRDTAIKANAAVRDFAAGNATYADFEAAYKEFSDTCDRCHKIFHTDTKN